VVKNISVDKPIWMGFGALLEMCLRLAILTIKRIHGVHDTKSRSLNMKCQYYYM